MTDDSKLLEAVIEIKEANKTISESMKSIDRNLKSLNDNNILHASTTSAEHKDISEKIQILTAKYWWLIILLLMSVFIVMGYKEIISYLPQNDFSNCESREFFEDSHNRIIFFNHDNRAICCFII